MDRRFFTISILAAAMAVGTVRPSLAKDGGTEREVEKPEDSEDSNDDGHDNSDGGSSGGSDKSGEDSGSNDDGGKDDGGGGDHSGGDDGGSGSGGSGSSHSGSSDSEHDQAKRAVDTSQALPLQDMMKLFRTYGDYTVIDVKLALSRDQLLYVFKFIDTAGNVRRAKFDAKTGALVT